MYDANLGRFFTQDRFSQKYQDLSPYQYVANNPIKLIDINGDSIWFTNKYDDDGNLSGVVMNVTGKVLNGTDKDVDIGEAISDITEGIESSFNGTIKVNGQEVSFTSNVQITEAESIDDVEESDHLIVLADGSGEAGTARGTSNQFGGKVAHAYVGDYPTNAWYSPGWSNTRTLIHEFGHLTNLEHVRNTFGNLMKQGGSLSQLKNWQLQKVYDKRNQLNQGANVVKDYAGRKIPNPAVGFSGGTISSGGLSTKYFPYYTVK